MANESMENFIPVLSQIVTKSKISIQGPFPGVVKKEAGRSKVVRSTLFLIYLRHLKCSIHSNTSDLAFLKLQ
jgi:hypothetical protein